MAKLSHSFSYTFCPKPNQWVKINLEVSDVNTELPIDPQMREVEGAVEIIWNFLRNKVDRQIEEIYDEIKSSNNSLK